MAINLNQEVNTSLNIIKREVGNVLYEQKVGKKEETDLPSSIVETVFIKCEYNETDSANDGPRSQEEIPQDSTAGPSISGNTEHPLYNLDDSSEMIICISSDDQLPSILSKSICDDHEKGLHGENPHSHCDLCKAQFLKEKEMADQQRALMEELQINCKICFKPFANERNLKRHMVRHDTLRQKYMCDICEKGFSERHHLRRHLLSHTMEKHMTCDLCKKAFKDKWNLTRHMRTHSEDKYFPCSVCDSTFKTKEYLLKHLARLHTISL